MTNLRATPAAPMQLHDALAPLALLTVIGGGGLATVLTWVAARAATPSGFVAPSFGTPTLSAMLAAASAGSLDPLITAAGSRLVFWLVLMLLLLPLTGALVGVLWWATTRSARFGSPQASLARRRDYTDMRGKGAAKRAVKLRPSLAGAPVHADDLGLRLGRLGSDDLYASEEDVTLTIAGPRSNKTSAMVVPAILSAPGPVITTSNKIDAYTLTVALRSQLGRVFILDPQRLVGAEQTWWWNPVAGCGDTADAQRLVSHFVATVGGGNERADPYFTPATARLLSQLVVAAARSDRSLRDVRHWLTTRGDEPAQLLEDAGLHSTAAGVKGLLEAPDEQQGGVYETALTALGCLESEAVARYVTPPDTWVDPPADPTTIIEFDPWQFLVGYDRDLYETASGLDDATARTVAMSPFFTPRDTLYALTREGAGTAAPVVAAMVDHLLLTTAEAATARGGRVDPPVRAVLDEAANICPIRNLPDLYSYFGSMSIQVMTFLQSEAQGVALWGKAGMDKLWSAATIKMIGAGVHDDAFCERISRLVGHHDVPTWSDQRGRGGGSTTRSTRRDRILEASDIAELTKEQAVLIATGRKSGLIRLLPWYQEPDAGVISDYGAQATDEVRRAAIATLGPKNPLARQLAEQYGSADDHS